MHRHVNVIRFVKTYKFIEFHKPFFTMLNCEKIYLFKIKV